MDPFDIQPQKQPLRVSAPPVQPRISQAPAPTQVLSPSRPIQTPVLSIAEPPAYTPLSVERIGTDVNPYIGQDDVNYFIADGSQRNPLTNEAYAAGEVIFEGPDWLVNNPLFESVKQSLERPVQYDDEGKPIHDILTDEFSNQLNSITEAASQINHYKRAINPGATDDDAFTYFQNVAAAERNDKDENTQIVWAVNANGERQTMSVKDYVEQVRGLNDSQKATYFRTLSQQMDNRDLTPQQRAIAQSLLLFMQEKDLLSPSFAAQFTAGGQSFMAESDRGAAGWLANQPTRFGQLGASLRSGDDLDFRTAAQVARDDLESNPLYGLPGLEAARSIGAISGTIGALGADVVASLPISGGLVAGLGRIATSGKTLSDAGRTVRGINAVANSLTELNNSGTAGRIIARTIAEMPQEAVFGGLQTAANHGDYDTAREFIIGTAFNAGMLGVPRAAGRVLTAIDPDASMKLARVNDAISTGILRGWDGAFDKMPRLNRATSKAVSGLVDSEREAARVARKLVSNKAFDEPLKQGETLRGRLKSYYNRISDLRSRGNVTFKDVVAKNQPRFDRLSKARIDLEAAGEDVLRQGNEYAWSVLQRQYHDAGKIRLSEDQLTAIDDAIAKGQDNALFNEYREALIDAESGVVDSFSARGLMDADAIEIMRNDEAFKNGYIHMTRLIEPDWTPPKGAKKFKDRAAVRRIRGSSAELADPMESVLDHARVLSEIHAQNQVTDLFRQAFEAGLISGSWKAAPESVGRANKIRATLRGEKEAIQSLIDGKVKEIAQNTTRLVDDAEDIMGPANRAIQAYLDDALEDISTEIRNDKRFSSAIKQVVDEMPAGTQNPERLASLEIMGAYRKDILDGLQKNFDTTRLDREASDVIERTLRNKIDEQTQIARAGAAGNEVQSAADLTTRQEAVTTPLSERREEMNRLRAEFEETNPNSIPYYSKGDRGYFELDDPVLQNYFNSTRRSAVDDGLMARLFMNSSRIFRAATTGLNPVFALMVNPVRDIGQSALTAGAGVLSPVVTSRQILRNAGVADDVADNILRQINDSVSMSSRVSTSRIDNPMLTQQLADYRGRLASEADGRLRQAKEHVAALKDNLKADRAALKKVEDITMGAPEMVVRRRAGSVAYAKAKARGATDEVALSEAIFSARNATTDFAPVGQSVQSFVRTVPYLTAAINGRTSFMRMWALDPMGVSARLAAGAVLPAYMVAAHNMRDAESAAEYFDIPEWERRANFIVMLPGNEILKIPLPQEVAAIINPFTEQLEVMHGLDRSLADRVFKTILSGSPVDVAGFAERDARGNIDFARAAAQTAGAVTPQLLQPILEIASGRDLYTGRSLFPSDTELYEQGFEGEITDADRTQKNKNSRTLRFAANLIGVPQGNLQNIVENYGGTVGQFLLNGLDRMVGAPKEEQGGRSVLDNTAQRFFGKRYSQANADFWDGVNSLEDEKNNLLARIENLATRANFEPENMEAYEEQRQAAIRSFGESVGQFADRYGRFYEQTGGLQSNHIRALVNLLNLGPSRGSAAAGTASAEQLQQAMYAAEEDARQRAQDIGLPDTTPRDQFGRLLMDERGELGYNFADTSRAGRILQDQYYGAPEQLEYEFNQIFKADKRNDIPSMNDIRSAYFDMMQPLYARARGQKGKAAQATYAEINAIQHEYLGRLTQRLQPLLDKYGPNVIRNNKSVLDEIARYVMVPGDYTPFAPGKNKQPYMARDAEAFILDYMGVGELNTANIPTDERVLAGIRQANTDIDEGRTSAAKFRLQQLQKGINAGVNYARQDEMDEIRRLIDLAN